ncbi:MAG: hypothetical protein AAGK78_06575, partial [Planctomycetota bacterium]
MPVVGHATSPLRSMGVEKLESRRLLSAGDLITDFGAGGVRAFDFDTQFVQTVLTAVEAPDGSLYLAGFSNSASADNNREYVARLTPDGDLDTAWQGDGILELDGTGAAENVTQLSTLPDGDVLVVRQTDAGSTVLRFNANGSVDSDNFGSITIDYPSVITPAELGSTTVFVAAGNEGNDPETSALLTLYLPDGEVRAVNGVRDLLGTQRPYFDVVDIQDGGGGSVVVLGNVRDPLGETTGNKVSVVKVDLNDLTIDTDFGTAGEASQPFANSDIFGAVSL